MNNKVRVYWNLHKKCWSIQDCKSGLVIDHKDKVTGTPIKKIIES